MLNMNTGHIFTAAEKTIKQRQVVLKHWTTIHLYAVTNFHSSLTMTVTNKNSRFSSFSSGFQKMLLRSDVELPNQTRIK